MKCGLRAAVFKKISFEIEEIILLAIILLNVLDALKLLSPELDYIKKIVSWTALGIVLYKAKISKLFSGQNKPWLDGILITGYFFLIIKNLVAYAIGSVATTSTFMKPFYSFLAEHAVVIDKGGLLIGLFMLLFVALHLTARTSIKRPSILAMLGEEKKELTSVKQLLIRLSKAIVVILLFFVGVFNLVMEWLAIAIDAPLLMIGLAVYLFFVIKHKEHFTSQSFLRKFGSFGSSFYQDVINHFKYRKTVFRALSGLVVLHLLTDAFNFVWPFLSGLKDPLYFNLLSTQHPSLFILVQQDILTSSIKQIAIVGVAYIGNIIGLLGLLLLPGFLWLLLYKNKPFVLTRASIATVLSSWLLMLLIPIFKIRPLFAEPVYGVDIIGQSALEAARIQPYTAVAISVLVGVATFYLSKKVSIEKQITKGIVIILQLFFLIYTIMFFASISSYYLNIIPTLFSTNMYMLGSFLSALFFCTAVFYVLGTGSFLIDTAEHAQSHLRYKDLRTKNDLSTYKNEQKRRKQATRSKRK